VGISAEAGWSAAEGGAVFILTDGPIAPNGDLIQLECLDLVEALELVESILLAAKQALSWQLTEGE
jgi:hypothetical protein